MSRAQFTWNGQALEVFVNVDDEARIYGKNVRVVGLFADGVIHGARWVRSVFIAPEHREGGVPVAMLEAAEQALAALP